MAKVTLTQAQRQLLGIIDLVEIGELTPEEAVEELATLKADAKESGVALVAEYELADFQRLRTAYASEYQSSTTEFDSSQSSY